MVPHGLCGFSRESPAPIIRIEPISNFNFFCFIDQLMKETAIANQLITLAMNDRKLRWKPIALPADDFVQKGNGLLPGKTPSENRMKSAFAISFAKGSTSSSRNGRRTRRGVSRRGI